MLHNSQHIYYIWSVSSCITTIPGGWLGVEIIRIMADSVHLDLSNGAELGNYLDGETVRITGRRGSTLSL